MLFVDKTRVALTYISLIIIAIMLNACGDSDSDNKSSASSSSSSSGAATEPRVWEKKDAAPFAIHFPPAVTRTESTSITVRGSALTPEEIAQINVNGIAATALDNDVANGLWQAEVPLTLGKNTLTVSHPMSAEGDTSTLEVYQSQSLFSPSISTAISDTEIVVFELLESTYFSINVDTGDRTKLLDVSETEDNKDEQLPRAPLDMVAHDGHLYVLDRELKAVAKINLADKSLSIIGANATEGDASESKFLLRVPLSITLDTSTTNARLLISDCIGYFEGDTLPTTCDVFNTDSSAKFAVFSLDLETTERVPLFEELYKEETIGDNRITQVLDSVVSPDGQFLYVSGFYAGSDTISGVSAVSSVFTIDMNTGEQSRLSDATFHLTDMENDPPVQLGSPDEINFSTAQQLTISADGKTLYALDPVGAPGIRLTSASTELQIEEAQRSGLGSGIFFIDIATKTRKILSYTGQKKALSQEEQDAEAEEHPNVNNLRFLIPRSMSSVGESLYVVDAGRRAVLNIAISNGLRTYASSETNQANEDVLTLFKPHDVIMAPGKQSLFISDEVRNRIFEINLANGEQSVVPGSTLEISSEDAPPMFEPKSLVSTDNVLYSTGFFTQAINTGFGTRTLQSNHVYTIKPTETNPSTPEIPGTRELLLNDSNLAKVPLFGLVHDPDNKRVLATGARRNSAGLLEAPVKDLGYIYALDTETGIQTQLFSALTAPFQSLNLRRPIAITLDKTNNQNRALIIDPSQDGLLAFDLDTLSLSVLSNSIVPDNQAPFLRLSKDIAMDPSSFSVLITDAATNGLVKVNLDTGKRSIFSEISEDYPDNPFRQPRGLTTDESKYLAYVVDEFFKTIVVIDLVTGQRIYLR